MKSHEHMHHESLFIILIIICCSIWSIFVAQDVFPMMDLKARNIYCCSWMLEESSCSSTCAPHASLKMFEVQITAIFGEFGHPKTTHRGCGVRRCQSIKLLEQVQAMPVASQCILVHWALDLGLMFAIFYIPSMSTYHHYTVVHCHHYPCACVLCSCFPLDRGPHPSEFEEP